jgi:hypothetical protein
MLRGNRRPSHRQYRVFGDGEGAIWMPIGAAWPNKDGLRLSIIRNEVLLEGRIALRAIQQRSEWFGAQ